MLMRLIPFLENFMNNKLVSYDIFFSGKKTPYPLLSISYANYVKQYLQTLRIKNIGERKVYGVLIHRQ